MAAAPPAVVFLFCFLSGPDGPRVSQNRSGPLGPERLRVPGQNQNQNLFEML